MGNGTYLAPTTVKYHVDYLTVSTTGNDNTTFILKLVQGARSLYNTTWDYIGIHNERNWGLNYTKELRAVSVRIIAQIIRRLKHPRPGIGRGQLSQYEDLGGRRLQQRLPRLPQDLARRCYHHRHCSRSAIPGSCKWLAKVNTRWLTLYRSVADCRYWIA